MGKEPSRRQCEIKQKVSVMSSSTGFMSIACTPYSDESAKEWKATREGGKAMEKL